jgi:hypothetical protein
MPFAVSLKLSQQPRGIAGIDSRLANVLGHHRSGTNDYVIADADRQHRHIGSDGDTFTYSGWLPERFVAAGRTTCPEHVIHKHRTVGDKTVLSYRHQLANKRVRLDFRAAADANIFLDFDEWTHEAAVPDSAAIKITWLDDRHVFSKRDVPDADLLEVRMVIHKRVSAI